MMPGLTSRLNELLINALPATNLLDPKADVQTINVAGTISTINAHFITFSGFLVIIPIVSGVILGTGGNIAVAGPITLPQNRTTLCIFSRSQQLWYPCTSAL